MTYYYEFVYPEGEFPVKAKIHSVDEIELHWHKQVEFILVLEGTVNIRLGQKKYLLQTGDFIFVNSNEVHNTFKTEEQNLLLAVQINPAFYAFIYPNFTDFYFDCNSFGQNDAVLHRHANIRKYLARISWEISRRQTGFRSRIGSYLFLLAGELIAFPFYNKADLDNAISDEDLNRLQRITNYIEQHLHRKLTLQEIGEEEHLSYYYLSHFIKDKMGISFQEYLKKTRMQRAVELLLSSEKSIAEIATETGFTSAAAFHISFKKEFQVPPGEYRNLINHQHLEYNPNLQYMTPKSDIDNDGLQYMTPKRDTDSDGQNIFYPPDASPPIRSRTYLDVDRQAALKTLYGYLDAENADQTEPGYHEPNSGKAKLYTAVDSDQPGQPWQPYWRKLTSFTRAAEGLRGRWQEQLQELQTEIGFEHIRFHGIFADEMMIYQTDLKGNVSYNWTYVDNLLDNFLKVGIKPFVELGFMPADLSRSEETVFWWKANISPPNDIVRWKGLVDAFIRHCINRYGLNEIESWYFEVWNEPELTNVYWAGTQEEYFDFYKETVLTVKAISPRIKVGGPAITGQAAIESPWLDDFLLYCRREQVPVDFVSLHLYPERYPDPEKDRELMDSFIKSDISYEKKNQMLAGIPRIYNGPDYTRQTLQTARAKIEKAWGSLPEICITEWNASAYNRNLVHDTVFVAAFIIHNVVQCIGLADMMAYWTFTDINE